MLMPNQVAQTGERRMCTVACRDRSTPGVRPASGATTFRQLVDARRPIAARALLDKAYLANRLAKLSTGHTRLVFYRLKTDCLSAAIEVYPDAFWIDAAEPRGISAILSIRSRLGTSLHVAAAELSLRARACLTQGRLGKPSMGEPLPSGDRRW
jgi:hypothetical protein